MSFIGELGGASSGEGEGANLLSKQVVQVESCLSLIHGGVLEKEWHQSWPPLKQGSQNFAPCKSQSLPGGHSEGEHAHSRASSHLRTILKRKPSTTNPNHRGELVHWFNKETALVWPQEFLPSAPH
jgi:hypothetical protein